MKHSQSGYILITGLIFLLGISLITISMVQGTNLDYKIASNETFKAVAFQGSESGRAVSGEAIAYYMYDRQWDGLTINGLTIPSGYDPFSDVLKTGEDLYNSSSLEVDLNFDLSSTAVETIDAEINVIKAEGVQLNKSALNQLSAYEGLGKGAGAGGASILFELRSQGKGPADAVAVTASEFKVTL